MQDCHNAMDSGTPKDALERCTETPNKTKQDSNNDNDDTSPDQDVQVMIHQYTLSMDTLDPESQTRFRDKDGTFQMETSVTRNMGKGSKLFTIPRTDTRSKATYSSPSIDKVTDTLDMATVGQLYNKSIADLTYNELCVLHATKKRQEQLI